MKNNTLALAIITSTLSLAAVAETGPASDSVSQVCPSGVTNCVIPNLGDSTQSADNSTSESTLNNPSSNSNVSDALFSPDNRDVINSSNDGSISGGNTSSSGGTNTATGGTYTTGDLSSTGGSIGDTSYNDSSSFASDIDNSTAHGNQDFAGKQHLDASNAVDSSNANDNTLYGGKQSVDSANQNYLKGGSQANKSYNQNKTGDSLSGASNQSAQALKSLNKNRTGDNALNVDDSSRINVAPKVDASDRSVSNYSSKSFVQAARFHSAPITLPSPTMNTVVMQCSPIPNLTSADVNGTHIGVFRNKSVPLGVTDRVTPNIDKSHFNYVTNLDGSVYEMGVQLVMTMAVPNVGSSRSMSVDVLEGLGKGGGAGASNSSAMQRLVTSVQAVPCVHGIYEPALEPEAVEEPDPKYLEYLQDGMKG